MRAEWGDGTFFNNAPADTVQLTLGKRFMEDQLDVSLEMKHAFANDRYTEVTRTPFFTVSDVGTGHTASHTTYDFNVAYTPNSGWLENGEVRFGIDNLTDEGYTPYLSTRPAIGRTFKFSVAKLF